MKTGIELIAEERQRQIDVEGWTPEHDDEHTDESLAMAAALYATPTILYKVNVHENGVDFIDPWPWVNDDPGSRTDGAHCWDGRESKPRLRQLTIAGALIAAEIDRIQRKQNKEKP